MSADRPSNAPEACVGPASEEAGKASACDGCPNQSACASGEGRKVDPAVAEVQQRLAEVRHKILVLSGKGGVGKSTFSSQLSWTLASQGYTVGILDIDICGPSVPRMLGVESQEVRKSNYGWSPVWASENLGVMSVAFMLGDRNDAIIWRGPRKNGLIKQFLTDVEWGALDFLIVDAPPGTSDEHISIATYMTQAQVDGAVIVTTPQEMALLDVRKEITFCNKVNVPVLGVVENMAGFVCPNCKTSSDIFPAVTGGARQMSADMKAPFLGSIPLDPNLLQSCEDGKCFIENYPDSAAVQPLLAVVKKLLSSTPALLATSTQHAAESPAATAPTAAAAAAASFSLVRVRFDDNLSVLVGVDTEGAVYSTPLPAGSDDAAVASLTHTSNAGPSFVTLRKHLFQVTGRSCTFHTVSPAAAVAAGFTGTLNQRVTPSPDGLLSIPAGPMASLQLTPIRPTIIA